MASYDPSLTGNYYILGDSQAEGVHLIEQDRNFTRSMGGLLPEQSEETIAGIHTALDVACGPGGWVLGMAQAYPSMHVTGVDISKNMTDYATVQARASGLDNASFQVGNITEPLKFPDASFDLVNARHIEEVIPVAAFAPLFKEFVRITKPGGIIRITGSEWGVTNSIAYEKLMKLLLQASRISGLDFSADGRNLGISPWLRRFLREAGCVNIQERASALDFSAGAEQQQSGYQDLTVAFELMQPFLTAVGVTTQQEVARLQQQLSVEMLEKSFRGLVYTLTAWGQKPEGVASQIAPSTQAQQNITVPPASEGDGTVPRLFHFDLPALKTLPELTNSLVSPLQHVLDVASGKGEWAISSGQAAPNVEILGIERDVRQVEHAREQAKEHGIANATFTVMDPFQHLDFAENSFDLVNVRYIVGLIAAEAWPSVLREFVRVTRPGGVIRLTEAELPITNSPAFAQLGGLISQAFFQTGRSFSPEGRLLSITAGLKQLVQDAGCQQVQQGVAATNFSSGTPAHTEIIQDIAQTYRLVLPFLVNTGVTTQQEVEQIYQQMLSEVQSDDFVAVAFSLTVLGKKQ
jgi:ubiquinone/menaquinone biosynthesis C-methylase UbiE